MTKILIEIDTDTQRVVPVDPDFDTTEAGWEAVNWNDIVSPNQLDKVWKAMLAAAPQPELVDVDLRRDAELWRAHQKRKQDLIDRGFLRNPLRAAPQDCLAEIVTIDAAMLSQGEQK